VSRHSCWQPSAAFWVGIVAPATALALDFAIPGRIDVYRDLPAENESPLDQVVGMDRPGAEGHYLLYSQSGGAECVSKDRRTRIPVWPSGGIDRAMRKPTVAADSDVVYADQRYYQGTQYNRDGFDVFRFRCTDPLKQSGNLSYLDPSRVRLSYDPAFTEFEPVGPMIAWDRRVCVVRRDAIGCASLDDPQPTLRTLVTAKEVAAGIAHPPFYDVPDWDWSMGTQSTFQDLFPGQYAFQDQPWGFHAAVALPDGGIVVLLKSEFQEPLPARAAYLLRLEPDGRIREVLHGPSTEWRMSRAVIQSQTNARFPLLGVTGLAWDPERKAVWIWPLMQWEWTSQKSFGEFGEAIPGWGGTGALAIRLDPFGLFYLPLSAALVDSAYERIRTDRAQANVVPDLREFVLLDGNRARIAHGRPTNETFVRWDPDSLDRDQDGLSSLEEAALGTDDWRWDSDGDGIADGVEAGLGRDPTRDEGYLADRAFDDDPAGLAESPWFATFQLPEAMPAWVGQKHFASNPGMNGPFCIDRTCHFRDGTALTLPHEVRAVSLDGRWAVDSGGAMRTDLWTGQTTPWLDPPFDPVRTGLAWYIEDADSAYVVVAPGNVAFRDVVHIDGQGQRRTLFHLDPEAEAAQYASLPDPGPYPAPHRGASSLWPIGFHQESGRLIVGVHGAWEAWIVALSSDHPPTILERAQGMTRLNRHVDHGTFGTAWAILLAGSFPNGMPFPWTLHPNGRGDYLSDRWVYGRWFEDGRLGAALDYLGADPLPALNLVGGFGDVLLDANTGSEIVSIPRRVEPGDVLALGAIPGEGMMLYRVGPRGGIATLWPSARQGYTFNAMGASATGRVCLVAGAPGEACPEGCVAEFSPSEESRIPDVLTGLITGRDYRDCAYADDDTLLLWRVQAGVPAEEASRLERWRRQGPNFVKEAEEVVTEIVSPQGLAEGPDGPSFVPGDQSVWVRMDDGSTVELSNRSDGPFLPRLASELSLNGLWVKDAVARPDGFVIALVSVLSSQVYPEGNYLVAYRPDQDRLARVLRYGAGEGIAAIARVPGGVGRNPWGDAVLPVGSGVDPGPGETAPLGPEVPSFGPGQPVATSRSGCRAGPSPVPLPVFLLLLWGPWWAWRRLRAG